MITDISNPKFDPKVVLDDFRFWCLHPNDRGFIMQNVITWLCETETNNDKIAAFDIAMNIIMTWISCGFIKHLISDKWDHVYSSRDDAITTIYVFGDIPECDEASLIWDGYDYYRACFRKPDGRCRPIEYQLSLTPCIAPKS